MQHNLQNIKEKSGYFVRDSNDMLLVSLSLLANICQLANFDMQIQQTSTDEIMKDLQNQDKILNEDIVKRLDIIIKQNEEIIGSIAKR